MLKPIRRIVTGHNAQGKSVIVSDGPSTHVLALLDDPPLGMTDLWVTTRTPADNTGTADAARGRARRSSPRSARSPPARSPRRTSPLARRGLRSGSSSSMRRA